MRYEVCADTLRQVWSMHDLLPRNRVCNLKVLREALVGFHVSIKSAYHFTLNSSDEFSIKNA